MPFSFVCIGHLRIVGHSPHRLSIGPNLFATCSFQPLEVYGDLLCGVESAQQQLADLRLTIENSNF